MKLLVYVAPWPENPHAVKGRSGFLKDWFKRFIVNLELGARNAGAPFSAKFVYPENPFLHPEEYKEEYVELLPVHLDRIQHIYDNHQDYMAVLTPEANQKKKDEMLSFFQTLLGDFTPDIIIGLTPCHFFRELYPNALPLVMEAGYFSRPPFPPTQYFDAAQHLSETFPAKHREAILASSNQDNIVSLLEPVFSHFKEKILEDMEINRRSIDPDNKYKSIVLLPLQFEGCPSFDHCCQFKNQTDLINHILPHIPEDVLLLVTKHQFSVIDEAALNANFQNTNVKFISEIGPVRVHVSQRLLPFIDGVITVSSSVGMQAAMWGKFCICIGNSHVKAFADSDDINDLQSLLTSYSPSIEKKKLISYLLAHYYVPFEFLWTKPDWSYEFFSNKLHHYRKTGDDNSLGFYNRLATNSALLSVYQPS